MKTITSILEAEKFLKSPKVIIFDLDDTLYSEKEYVKSGYKKIAEAFPQIKDMDKKLWEEFECKHNAIDEVLKKEGKFSAETKEKCLEIYRSHYPSIKPYQGIIALLTSLHKDGKHIGMITDGRPLGQQKKIEALGIKDFFEKIIITDELGGIEYRKPNVHSFLMMKEYFNADYCDMAYIGDNIKKDFVAPNALGMISIFFDNPEGLYFCERDK